VAGADAELRAWLRLLLSDGLGRPAARRLLAAFGSAAAVLDAGGSARRAVVSAAQAQCLDSEPADLAAQWDLVNRWTDGGEHRQVLTLADASYPEALLQTADPPLLLFAQGRLAVLARPALAIVGSRSPTPTGADNARAFAAHLSAQGWVVVSGLARGIDGAAHEGALGGAGSTIAVVGTGLDRVYPAAHRALAHRIAAQGLMLSEFPLGTPPLAPNFPMRNRVIAGLARGTLVVEAAVQSGSLITARLAAEAGREVFALPGSLHSPQARGCNALIKQGAKLVESAADILDELQPQLQAAPAPAVAELRADTDPVLQALGHDPASLDALLARTGLPVGHLNARLLELELGGDVARLPGGLFQRRALG
jgi:DNA processing protein